MHIAKHKTFTSRTGFTLLELTISVAIIGIIVLLILGALRLGLRSVESGEKRISSLERLRTSMNVIDSQIQSFIPLTYDDNGERKYYFKGERAFMQFSTNYSIWSGEKGYVIVTYSVKTDEGGKQVLYANENVVGMEGQRETKLFDSFQTVYFEYFFKDPTEQEGKWVDQWTDFTRTPRKVRLHFIEGAIDFSVIVPMRVKGSPSGLSGSGSISVDEDE